MKSAVAVIDGDTRSRHSTAVALETAGFRVDSFEEGTAFLSVLDERLFAAIVADPAVPLEDGTLLIDHIASARPELLGRLIATQSYRSDDEPASDWGAFAILRKPFAPANLIAIVSLCAEDAEGG